MIRFDYASLAGLLIALSGFFLAELSPQWTAFGVIVALLLFSLIFRTIFHPAMFLGISLTTVLLIGGLNISTYRGTVTDETFSYILRCITLLVGTASVGSMFPLASPQRVPRRPVLRYWAILPTLLPGLLGVLWIVATVGIPLLSPSARFGADAKALFLAETASVTASLIALRYYYNGRASLADWSVLFVIAVTLLIPGYRNWVIVAALVNIIGLVRVGAVRFRPVPAAIFSVLALGFLGAVSEFRRAVSPELMSGDLSLEKYHVEYLPSVLAQLHFGLRESVALTGQLISRHIDFHGSPVFLADLLTMLPGNSTSGGRVLAESFGAVLQGGLTPGLVGVWTVEYGAPYCLLGFGLAGIVAAVLWRWSSRSGRPEVAILYGYFIVNFLLLFHRGVLKPSMVFVPAFFFLVVALLKSFQIRVYGISSKGESYSVTPNDGQRVDRS